MSDQDFTFHLRRQLIFIANSCERFDRGERDEGIRIAASLRVLFHDTRMSTSLMTRLGAKDAKIASVISDELRLALKPDQWRAAGVLALMGGNDGWNPILDFGLGPGWRPWKDWWTDTIRLHSWNALHEGNNNSVGGEY